MIKKLSYSIVGWTLTVLSLAACADKSPNGRTDTLSSGAVVYASDESFSPFLQEEQEVFLAKNPQASLTPIWTNESDGLNLLLSDSTWLMFTARDLKPNEREYLEKRNYRPRAMKIAYDALALIVNKNSSDTIISVGAIRKIMNGEITRWEQLPGSKEKGLITIVFDNKKSSAVHFIEDSVLGGKAITNSNVAAVKTSAEVVSYVENNKGTIGIIGSNWLNDKRDTTNLTFNKNIRVMRVSKHDVANLKNSFGPYQAYIYTGDYPLVRTIYGILNDAHNGLPTGFIHFIQSPIGQKIILKTGLLPMYGNVMIRDVKVSE